MIYWVVLYLECHSLNWPTGIMAESVVCTVDSDLPFAHNMVNGVAFPEFITQQRMDYLKTFNLLPDDVFVASYPKSGMYW